MRKMRRIVAALAVILAFATTVALSLSNQQAKSKSASSALGLTEDVTIDANQLEMFVYNNGNFAYDNIGVFGKSDGLYFPRGTNKTVVYAAGLWLGATVRGDYTLDTVVVGSDTTIDTIAAVRIAQAEYESEFLPGNMEGGIFNPNWQDPQYRLYKIKRGDNAATNPDYAEWPVDDGAPVDSLGNPALLGDQLLWSVYNDADSSMHQNESGGTLPLGVEVQQSTFAVARSGALGNCIFMKFKIINKGGDSLQDAYVSIWADPDIGNAGDDLVGCDTSLSLGYCYNSGPDDVYGSNPPAVGFDFLQGPIVPGDYTDTGYVSGVPRPGYRNLPMTSFNKYINGEDPRTPDQTYDFMRGLRKSPITGLMEPAVNPITMDTTTFVLSGDPVTGTGWIDSSPDDRRLMLSSGPFDMNPGDTQEVICAVLVGQGSSALNSVTELRDVDSDVQIVYDGTINIPLPPGPFDIYVRGYDQAADLLWNDSPLDFHVESVPLNQSYIFEGFNVYQGESQYGPWHRFATYDKIDGIKLIYNDVYDPEAGGIQRVIVQDGSDSGVKLHEFTTVDHINGGPLINGQTYYFAVTFYAYDVNHLTEFNDQYGNLLGYLTPVLESPFVPYSVTPSPSGAALVDTADHIAGISDGIVVIEYLIPDEMTNDEYRVTFNPNGTWNLIDMTLASFVIQNYDGQGPGYDFPIVDGFMPRVLGPSLGVRTIEEVANASGPLPEPVNVNHSANSTGEWYIQDGANGGNLARYSWAYPTAHDYEIRFTENADQYCWDWFGDPSGDYSVPNPFQVPIEVWDIGVAAYDYQDDDRRITFMLYLDAWYDYFTWGDGLYFDDISYDDVDWTNPSVNSGDYDPDYDRWSYRRFYFEGYLGAPERPEPGTVVRIITNKLNTTQDEFAFRSGFICGDTDGSGRVNLSDAIYLLNYLFGSGMVPLDASGGDVSCDSRFNITDVVYMIAYIFGGGPAPCADCP